MHLNLKNLLKVKDAAIEIQDLCVLTGEDEDTKSLICYTLFSLLSTFNKFNKCDPTKGYFSLKSMLEKALKQEFNNVSNNNMYAEVNLIIDNKSLEISILPNGNIKSSVTDGFNIVNVFYINKYIELNEVINEANINHHYLYNNSDINKIISLCKRNKGKIFEVITMLLENRLLKENSLLILEMPENYLHPKLHLVVAKILVLLQKTLNTSIVINTNSVYIIRALEVYIKLIISNSKCCFYMTDYENEKKIIDVTDRINLVYKQFFDPLQMLEGIYYLE